MTPNHHQPHISLELAKQLQEAGLKHGFGAGDYGYLTVAAVYETLGDKAIFYTLFSNVFEYLKEVGAKEAGLNGNTVVFAPSIRQMKEEIEERGYYVGIIPIRPHVSRVYISGWKSAIDSMILARDDLEMPPMVGENLAELFGQALLRVLKQRKAVKS